MVRMAPFRAYENALARFGNIAPNCVARDGPSADTGHTAGHADKTYTQSARHADAPGEIACAACPVTETGLHRSRPPCSRF